MGPELAIPLLVGLGTSAASAGLSVAAANEQNKQTKKAYDSNKAMLEAQAADQRQRLARQYDAAAGAARAAAASRGQSGSGSANARQSSLVAQSQTGLTNLGMQAFFNEASLGSQANAQMQDPFVLGLQGGIQGLQFGMNLGQSIYTYGQSLPGNPTSNLADPFAQVNPYTPVYGGYYGA